MMMATGMMSRTSQRKDTAGVGLRRKTISRVYQSSSRVRTADNVAVAIF
jgi:hypothetical protein